MTETNELTRKLRTLLHPKAALIAYTSDEDNSFFLEIREIDEEGNMGEGRPVTVEFMNELVRGYSERHSTTPYGKMPTNLLWCDLRKGSERYIWYNPPQKRMMFFMRSLQIENAEYNLPGVIYEAGEHGMNIYAYKDKELKTDSTLYAAPFFNVTGASVCLGAAKIDRPKDLTYANLQEYWEKKFWLTEFSHLGGNGNPTKSNLVLVTKAARDRDFNLDELKPLNNLKLKDILK
jgi:PRTRC genetic system protein B